MRILDPNILEEPVIPNTFIGGVGATSVTSAADLAAISSLLEAQILGFQVDGNNNVSCRVEVNYNLNAGSFTGDLALTYFIDEDGYNTYVRDFQDCTNLQYLYLPNATNAGQQFDSDDVTNLERVNIESIVTILNRFIISDSDALEKLDLRSLTNISVNDQTGTLCQNTGLKRFYLGKVTSINATNLNSILIRNTGRQPTFYLNGNVSGDMVVYHSASWGVADRAAFTRIRAGWQVGDTCTINGLVYTAVNGAPATDGEFDASAGGNTAHNNFRNAVNADTRTGSADIEAISDNAFACIRATATGVGGNSITAVMGVGNTGTASVDWSPFKYGNDIHHALVDMRDIEGATMVEVSTPITVNTPTNLEVLPISDDYYRIDFTAPTANANGTDGYEVWVDDGTVTRKFFYFREITTPYTTINVSGLTSPENAKFKVRTFDGHYNFSGFTAEVTPLAKPDWTIIEGAYAFQNIANLDCLQNEVIEIRRSSDDTTKLFRWDSDGMLSLDSLEVGTSTTLGSWIGANDGFIVTQTAQRQTGNAWNVSYELQASATTTFQPKIIDAGVLITDPTNGLTGMQFDGVDDFINTFSESYEMSVDDSPSTYIVVCSNTDQEDLGGVVTTRFNDTNRLIIYNDTRATGGKLARFDMGTNYDIDLLSNNTSLLPKMLTVTKDSNENFEAYFNGTSQGTNTFVGTFSSGGKLRLGDERSGVNKFKGVVQAFFGIESVPTTQKLSELHSWIKKVYRIS